MIDRRRLAGDLTDLMIRVLHYQENGEPHFETVREWTELPAAMVRRYQNEPIFHAQVERAVASVLEIVRLAERDADRVRDEV